MAVELLTTLLEFIVAVVVEDIPQQLFLQALPLEIIQYLLAVEELALAEEMVVLEVLAL